VDGDVRFDAGTRGAYSADAVVLDWSKYCRRVESVDEQERACIVEPGIVLDVLNENLSGRSLRFGPEPATHMNCTLVGMIGNNSCGATAQRTGKVVDNVAALEVLLHDGCAPAGIAGAAVVPREPYTARTRCFTAPARAGLVDGTGAPSRALAVLP